jgi:DNA-binding NarL/FixJ family response regulator
MMRPIGMMDELKLRLPSRPMHIAAFSLLRDRRFSAHDYLLLDLLAAHLARARERATRRELTRADVDLTDREWEVLVWVARGKTNADIARLLHVAPSTIRKHLEHVFEKLGVHTRTAAVARAFVPTRD